jgi:hypothetical protein
MQRALVTVLLLAGSVTAAAQGYRYGRSGAYRPADPAFVVQGVMRNLHFAFQTSYIDRHERDHFRDAISELQLFQDRWTRQRRVDLGRLDRAIDNMKHLADARQVDRRARRMIDRDIDLLRDLRAQLRHHRF